MKSMLDIIPSHILTSMSEADTPGTSRETSSRVSAEVESLPLVKESALEAFLIRLQALKSAGRNSR